MASASASAPDDVSSASVLKDINCARAILYSSPLTATEKPEKLIIYQYVDDLSVADLQKFLDVVLLHIIISRLKLLLHHYTMLNSCYNPKKTFVGPDGKMMIRHPTNVFPSWCTSPDAIDELEHQALNEFNHITDAIMNAIDVHNVVNAERQKRAMDEHEVYKREETEYFRKNGNLHDFVPTRTGPDSEPELEKIQLWQCNIKATIVLPSIRERAQKKFDTDLREQIVNDVDESIRNKTARFHPECRDMIIRIQSENELSTLMDSFWEQSRVDKLIHKTLLRIDRHP